ncbi:hypothetical protein EV690_1086 [Celerinatantimonas diazotrophica]|uniref:Uncharacterized protein n=1 Tax=Celerinatantimonas diazotrophica TaxID=412034 RepID=A0A4R1K487_9GAMM|nr:hypothetical protein EV690_1086 [Celerinatantimonas diazotrophica]CAG9297561.1 hypothetical protein CEDIAZO_02749 [Celerinatantimonas diazotrophica]
MSSTKQLFDTSRIQSPQFNIKWVRNIEKRHKSKTSYLSLGARRFAVARPLQSLSWKLEYC